jgi:hypothetical protein
MIVTADHDPTMRAKQFRIVPRSLDTPHDPVFSIISMKEEGASEIHEPTSRFIDRR